jgi:membrane-associated PAP2 superfamily phosphatase
MKTSQPPTNPNAEYDGSFRISALFFIFTAIFAFWFALMLAIAIGGKVVLDFLLNGFLFLCHAFSSLAQSWDVVALSVLCTILISSAGRRLLPRLTRIHDIQVPGKLRTASRRI